MNNGLIVANCFIKVKYLDHTFQIAIINESASEIITRMYDADYC